MNEFWSVAVLELLQLRRAGFSIRQIERLTSLKGRVERGECNEFASDTRRLRFVRWLVRHGRLTEAGGPPYVAARSRGN